MRIVFMGTPDFAVPSLQAVIDMPNHQVVGVFTQPDRPKGRKFTLTTPPVKELALANNLPVYQPEKMRDGTVLGILQQLMPDLIIAVAYGRILPKDILDLPPCGCVNVHGSLLPKYRGAGPVQRCVIDGETITGVTTMYLNEGMDTGDMILKLQTEIDPEETAGELMDRLAIIGAKALVQTLELIEKNEAQPTPQDEAQATYAPMLAKEDGLVDFTRTATVLHNQIRGVSPWPGASAFLDGKRFKIHKAVVLQDCNGTPGEIFGEKELCVYCGQGALKLLFVQPEGGKQMSGESFLLGNRQIIGKKFTAFAQS